MRTKSVFLCLLALLAWPLAAAAQDAPTADAKVSTEKTEAKPTHRTAFGEAFSGHWQFTADASFDQEYDDNVFSSGFLRLSDNISRFSVRLSAAVQKKQLSVQIHYVPDYVAYAKYSDRNALSHQYYQEIGYRFSGHTDLNWQLTGMRQATSSNSPFSLVDFDGVFLPVFRPSALQNDATVSNVTSTLTWSHRFSARNSLTVAADGTAMRFDSSNGVALSPLSARKSFSSGVKVRWENEFVPRHHLGVEFGEQYFGFLDPGSHSHYQFVKARYSQDFGADYHVTLGAGPSRSERQAVAGVAATSLESTGYAIDASLNRITARQNLGLIYSHGQQLGLTQGGLASDSISVSMMRRFGRKWTINGGFGYSRNMNESLAQQITTDSYSANSSIEYQLLPDLALNAGYSYISQNVTQTLPGAFDFDRNVFKVGVHYTFQWLTSR